MIFFVVAFWQYLFITQCDQEVLKYKSPEMLSQQAMQRVIMSSRIDHFKTNILM